MKFLPIFFLLISSAYASEINLSTGSSVRVIPGDEAVTVYCQGRGSGNTCKIVRTGPVSFIIFNQDGTVIVKHQSIGDALVSLKSLRLAGACD